MPFGGLGVPLRMVGAACRRAEIERTSIKSYPINVRYPR